MASANLVDRLVAYWSPARGYARMTYRLAYEASRTGRRRDGWITMGNSADTEVAAASTGLRNDARDLVRNNVYAKRGLAALVTHRVGSGITVEPEGKNQRVNDWLLDRWNRWCDRAELSGKIDWYGAQALAERSRSESGEVLLRFIPVRMADEYDIPFRVQLLEADFLDTLRNQKLDGGGIVRHGIEYSAQSPAVPVAYYLFDVHPGEIAVFSSPTSTVSRRVPAEEVVHLYRPARPGQTRGITEFTAVLSRLKALDDYDDAEVVRKRVAACLAAFVTTPAGLPAASLGAVEGNPPIETFRPGMIPYLKPGEGVTVADPRPSTDYRDFNVVQLHAVAAGLDLPYELLSSDLSEINYSSIRTGLVQFKAQVEMDQWQMLVPQLINRVFRRFLVEARRVDGRIDPTMPVSYNPPRFPLLDPAKETPPMVDALRAGLESYPNLIRSLGYDWRKKLAEIKEFYKAIDKDSIVIDADARNEKKAAGTKPPAPAAPAQPDVTPADQAAA